MSDAADNSPKIDPGWLFLVAGLALLGATVLIPATEDLARARVQRDRALAVEQHRLDRLDRYERFLADLEAAEPSLVFALAERQLNQIPEGRDTIPGTGGDRAADNLSIFPALEPPPVRLPEYTPSTSLLARWTSNPRTRLLLVAAGGICVLIGLLPPARPRSGAVPPGSPAGA
jgi:hypothetical protein